MKKKLLMTLTVGFFMFVFAGMAGATVLTFDDLAPTASFANIPNGYGGFNWDEFGYVNGPSYLPGSGYDNGTVSGEYSAFNLDASVAKVEDMEFNFHGAYLTAAWNDGLNIQVEGFKGQALLYDNTIVVNTASPTWFPYIYSDIDKLVFTPFDTTGGTQFVMDDFTYTTTHTPEPTTMLLLGTGLVGVAGAARRKKKNQA